ncbi:MAG: isoprenylcysteine carboxylmethyltransferase family protein, partial [Pseudomonadota bacterium]|nr:isoprenylcysteine carboxylmethyltransferase family protein [Pseudomonadota bacterium]
GALGWGLALCFPDLRFDGSWGIMFALVLFIAGVTLLALALASFFQAKTTANPIDVSRAETLVTSGLFRLSRNPMYLGMLLILIGGVFWIGNWAACLAPAIFVFMMTELQIKPEERALKDKFGDAYIGYCKRTRRWI